MSESTATAEVLVATLDLYNEGLDEIQGKWFDLTDYEDHDTFMAAASKYVSEELSNGDTAVQPYFSQFNVSFLIEGDTDYNFDIDALIGEGLSPSLWFMLKLSDDDLNMVNAYCESTHPLFETIEENYKVAKEKLIGYFPDIEDFGKHYMKELKYLESVPEELLGCIDFNEAGEILSDNTNDYNGYFFQK